MADNVRIGDLPDATLESLATAQESDSIATLVAIGKQAVQKNWPSISERRKRCRLFRQKQS